MPEELWRAAATAARRYGVSHVASALGLGYASLKGRTMASPPEGRQASPAMGAGGFIEVGAAQLLAPAAFSSVLIEYAVPGGGRLTITVPASSHLDIPALLSALRGA